VDVVKFVHNLQIMEMGNAYKISVERINGSVQFRDISLAGMRVLRGILT